MTNRYSVGLLVLLAAASFAYGKGSPDMILISGGGLLQPIEITDSASLNAFDPWRGQFADWQQKPFADAPCFRRSFEVLFYMKWLDKKSLDHGNLRMIYATRYCSTGLSGYVYLPGLGDPQYQQNIGAIMRGDAEGKWYPATPAWDSLLRNAMAAREQQAVP